jgi:hypothetical protein
VFVGDPMDFSAKIAAFKAAHPNDLTAWKTTLNAIQLYEEITLDIRDKLLELEAEAFNFN